MVDKIIQVGNLTQDAEHENPQRDRAYDPPGIASSLIRMGGGNLQPFIAVCNEYVELEGSADERQHFDSRSNLQSLFRQWWYRVTVRAQIR